MRPEAVLDRRSIKIGIPHSDERVDTSGYSLMRPEKGYLGSDVSQVVLHHDTNEKVMAIDKERDGTITAYWDTELPLGAFVERTEKFFSHFDDELPIGTTTGIIFLHQKEYNAPLTAEFMRPLRAENFIDEGVSLLDEEQVRRLDIRSDVGTMRYDVPTAAIALELDLYAGMEEEKIEAAKDFFSATQSDIPADILAQVLSELSSIKRSHSHCVRVSPRGSNR